MEGFGVNMPGGAGVQVLSWVLMRNLNGKAVGRRGWQVYRQ